MSLNPRKVRMTTAQRNAIGSIIEHRQAFVQKATWDALYKKGVVDICPVSGNFILTDKGREAWASGLIEG